MVEAALPYPPLPEPESWPGPLGEPMVLLPEDEPLVVEQSSSLLPLALPWPLLPEP